MEFVLPPPFTLFFPYLSKFSLPFPLYLASILLAPLNLTYIGPSFSSPILHSPARSHKISADSHMNLSLPFIFVSNRFQSSLLKSWLNLFLARLPTIPPWSSESVSMQSPSNYDDLELSVLIPSIFCSFLYQLQFPLCVSPGVPHSNLWYCSGTASSWIYPSLCLCSRQAATHPMKLQYCQSVNRR